MMGSTGCGDTLDNLVAMMDHGRWVGGLEEAVIGGGLKRSLYPISIFETSDEIGDDDVGDDCSHHVEKKRRLTVEQVRSLEKNFELENKLEPERKTLLARELGLQPRQVAVWFQNRRARWKTKQLERDYDALKSKYANLEFNYDSVLVNNKSLQAEVNRLKKSEAQLKRKLDGQDFEIEELDVVGDIGPHSSEMALKSEPFEGFKLTDQEESYQLGLPTVVSTAPPVASMSNYSRESPLQSPLESRGGGGGGSRTCSESNSSEIMNADSPHLIDSGVSPGVDQKSIPFKCSQQGFLSRTDSSTTINEDVVFDHERQLVQLDALCATARLPHQRPGGPVKVEDEMNRILNSETFLCDHIVVTDEQSMEQWWTFCAQ